MNERRSTYFIFQGLLTIILLLFYFYRREQVEDWPLRLSVLMLLSGGLLFVLAKAPAAWLENPTAQGAWFLIDIVLASATLYWIKQPTSDLYLAYFLVIFGTAITHSMTQSFLVALVATILYSYLSWHTMKETPQEFWLRLPFLWIVASFTGLLSRDSHEEQKKREAGYRERLFHLERLAALGQVAAEIAHRIKAPLTSIRVTAEVLVHQKDIPSKRKAELEQIQHEVDHCKDVLQKLLSLGRIEELETEPTDLRKTLRSTLANLKTQLTQRRVELTTSGLQGTAMTQGDPALLSEAFSAIIQNALEAMPEGGKLEILFSLENDGKWWPLITNGQERWKIVITDSGTGIELDKLETVFRPFYSTKKDKGNGLGLSSALRILDKHGGSIHASSGGPGCGACFTLTLPVKTSEPQASTRPAVQAA